MKAKETNTSVSKITYKLYISDNVDNLKAASSCEHFLPDDIIVIDLEVASDRMLDSDLNCMVPVLI